MSYDVAYIASLILLGIGFIALGLFIYFVQKEDKKREQH
jgi:uncharacterized membrane protein